MRLIYLCFPTWIYLSYSTLPPVSGAGGECDVNVCDEDDSSFLCATGSLIVIQEVMCRTRGRNCDLAAYQEVARLCAGRQHCDSSDLWLVSGKYCERNIDRQFLSIVFVSYVCVQEKAIESDCSQRGTRVSSDQRYLSSPGYPSLVTGNSVCTWRLRPPPGLHTDIFIREYLHLDNTRQQYLNIHKLATNTDVLNLDGTAKRDLTTTIDGEVEISLHTDGSNKGHRMFIEYRYVTPPLEHLRPFPVFNKSECGATVLDKKAFPGVPGIITPSPAIPVSSFPTAKTSSPKDINPSVTSTRTPPRVNGTDIQSDTGPSTVVTISIAVCAVGLCCFVVAIWIACRHRRKKSGAQTRNNSTVAGSAKASLAQGRPTPLATSPRQYPKPTDRVDFVRQSEMVHLKSGIHSPHEFIVDGSAVDETYTGDERLDKNGKPLDLSKYIISETDNTTNTIASKTSSQSSNGNIYEVVRDH